MCDALEEGLIQGETDAEALIEAVVHKIVEAA